MSFSDLQSSKTYHKKTVAILRHPMSRIFVLEAEIYLINCYQQYQVVPAVKKFKCFWQCSDDFNRIVFAMAIHSIIETTLTKNITDSHLHSALTVHYLVYWNFIMMNKVRMELLKEGSPQVLL